MYYRPKTLVLTAAAVVLGGTLLHFLYVWLPCSFTAVFSPVNESLWEHVKIIFWPFLLGALFVTWGRPGAIRPWLLVLPLLCAAMLAVGWVYHVSLRGDAMWVDILLYVLLIGLGFWLSSRFSGPFVGVSWWIPAMLCVGLGLLILLFTAHPPAHPLFHELPSC